MENITWLDEKRKRNKNRVHILWDIVYHAILCRSAVDPNEVKLTGQCESYHMIEIYMKLTSTYMWTRA